MDHLQLAGLRGRDGQCRTRGSTHSVVHPRTPAPPTVARTGGYPPQLLLLAASLITAFSGLLMPSSTAMSMSFGDARFAWYGGLCLAALAVLVGITRGGIDGLLIERAGTMGLVGTCASYTLSNTVLAGAQDMLPESSLCEVGGQRRGWIC
jgi:hypothetical protein